MKSWFKIALLILGAMIAYAVYWLALILYSLNTVIIKNNGDRPITFEVYGLSWTIDANDRAVIRFQSDEGDGGTTVRDTETQEAFIGGAYITHSSPTCHKITVTSAGELTYDVDYGSFCHLLNW